MFAQIKGIPSSIAHSIVSSLMKEVGVESHADKLAGQLSGGNQRKVQLAMALIGYPKVYHPTSLHQANEFRSPQLNVFASIV